MRNLTSIIAIIFLLPLLAPAQMKYKIVILGSSTAYGVGATVPDSSWVGRTKAYYKNQDLLDTIINLAVPGSFSDSGVKLLPTAMSYNPDIVIVSFPSNDIVAALGVPLLMRNFRTMYATVTAAGKKCFIATTQPRTDMYQEANLRAGRDSVVMEFPDHYLQFYDPLVLPASNDPNPAYVVDGVHPNNAGHNLLFQVVVATQVIPSIPLPLTLTSFTGSRTQLGVELSWSASGTDVNTDFFVERSTEGTPFQTISEVKSIPDGMTRKYSFTDQNAPATQALYRIRTVTDGNTTYYSKALSFDALTAGLAIQRIYITAGRRGITTTIDIPKDGTFRLAIFNTSGIPLQQQSYTGRAPAVTLDIPLPPLPAGIYFLQVATPDGQRITKPFTVL